MIEVLAFLERPPPRCPLLPVFPAPVKTPQAQLFQLCSPGDKDGNSLHQLNLIKSSPNTSGRRNICWTVFSFLKNQCWEVCGKLLAFRISLMRLARQTIESVEESSTQCTRSAAPVSVRSAFLGHLQAAFSATCLF